MTDFVWSVAEAAPDGVGLGLEAGAAPAAPVTLESLYAAVNSVSKKVDRCVTQPQLKVSLWFVVCAFLREPVVFVGLLCAASAQRQGFNWKSNVRQVLQTVHCKYAPLFCACPRCRIMPPRRGQELHGRGVSEEHANVQGPREQRRALESHRTTFQAIFTVRSLCWFFVVDRFWQDLGIPKCDWPLVMVGIKSWCKHCFSCTVSLVVRVRASASACALWCVLVVVCCVFCGKPFVCGERWCKTAEKVRKAVTLEKKRLNELCTRLWCVRLTDFF